MINSEFTANRDMVDSLKLDASILTPKQDNQVKIVAKESSNELITLYGRFISNKTIKEVQGIEDRILVSDTDAFSEMYTSWNTIIITPTLPEKVTKGTYFVQGRIIAIDNPDRLWDTIFPEEVQKSLIKQIGNEEETKQLAAWICLVDFRTHEVTHQYQNHNLPETFLECAVRYYQRQVSEKLRIGHIIEDISEERISFYEKLIGQYGNDMHRLFFSGDIDERKKIAILKDFNQEAERLFPK